MSLREQLDRILGRHSVHFNYSKAETREKLLALFSEYALDIIGEEEYGTDNYRPFLVATKTIPLEKNIHAAKIVLIARNQLREELRLKVADGGLEKPK
jgi:hypothetical protein